MVHTPPSGKNALPRELLKREADGGGGAKLRYSSEARIGIIMGLQVA